MNHQVELIDLLARTIKVYQYTQNETIGELKQKILKSEKYENGTDVKIRLNFIPLKDEFMVKDFVDFKDHGLFVEFPSYPIRCMADNNVLVWIGRKSCQSLLPGVPEVFQFPKKGRFAVTRNK